MERAEAVRAWLVTPGRGDLTELRCHLEAAIADGVRGIQLRERFLEPRELLELAQDLRTFDPTGELALLVSDRVDVAHDPVFDGVQLGFRSLAPEIARELLGPRKWIRRSVHELSEVEALAGSSRSVPPIVDALTFGPIFDTESKRGLVDPRGTELLERAVALSSVPLTAIGGLEASVVAAVSARGVHSLAAIGVFLDAAKRRAFLRAVAEEGPRA